MHRGIFIAPSMKSWIPNEVTVVTYNALSLRRLGARQTLAVKLSNAHILAAGVQEARPYKDEIVRCVAGERGHTHAVATSAADASGNYGCSLFEIDIRTTTTGLGVRLEQSSRVVVGKIDSLKKMKLLRLKRCLSTRFDLRVHP